MKKHVDDRTCPVFLMHTAVDDVVTIEYSLHFAKALANQIIFMGRKELEDNEVTRCIPAAVEWIARIISNDKL